MIDFLVFKFTTAVLKGVVAAGGILFWNLGLIAAPVLPENRVETAAIIQQIPAEVAAVKSEIEILKQELAELKGEKVVPPPAPKPKPAPAPKPASAPKPAPVPVPVPVPAPVPVPVVVPVSAPATVPVPPPTPALAPGQFLTPSGAIVDANGRLISGPPDTTPTNAVTPVTSPAGLPAPTPASIWPPAVNSTVPIARYIALAVELNSTLACNQLSFGGQELKLCELYKNSKSSYTWVYAD